MTAKISIANSKHDWDPETIVHRVMRDYDEVGGVSCNVTCSDET